MRDAFAKEMKLLAERKKEVVLLSGDIGNRMLFIAFRPKYDENKYGPNPCTECVLLSIYFLKCCLFELSTSMMIHRPLTWARPDTVSRSFQEHRRCFGIGLHVWKA